MHQNCCDWGSAQTTLGKLTAIQIPMMYIIMWLGTEKNGFEICEFTGRVGGLPGCVSDLTGNNLANFVCNYQKFSISE